VLVLGEESLYKEGSDLRNESRTCVLIDMIDGTDLLQRGFSNWCSAVVVFEPAKKQIKAAFVALSSRAPYLYFATQEKAGAFKKPLVDDRPTKNRRYKKKRHTSTPIPLAGPTSDRLLRDASICVYAQKNKNFLELLALGRKRKLVSWLEQHIQLDKRKRKRAQEELKFRFYNLAGNPMMVRLAEGVVDVVFDLKGQAPHDVVPGAFIALKAKAVFGPPTGKPMMNETVLATKLLEPSKHRIKYVLAANTRVYREIVKLLS
jgi:fructose-1,6-bisphosphatase/inositol monophosphatase family enzyme